MDKTAGGPRVIGAGLPRTGTKSLQAALHEVFDNQDHVAIWQAALDDEPGTERPPKGRHLIRAIV